MLGGAGTPGGLTTGVSPSRVQKWRKSRLGTLLGRVRDGVLRLLVLVASMDGGAWRGCCVRGAGRRGTRSRPALPQRPPGRPDRPVDPCAERRGCSARASGPETHARGGLHDARLLSCASHSLLLHAPCHQHTRAGPGPESPTLRTGAGEYLNRRVLPPRDLDSTGPARHDPCRRAGWARQERHHGQYDALGRRHRGRARVQRRVLRSPAWVLQPAAWPAALVLGRPNTTQARFGGPSRCLRLRVSGTSHINDGSAWTLRDWHDDRPVYACRPGALTQTPPRRWGPCSAALGGPAHADCCTNAERPLASYAAGGARYQVPVARAEGLEPPTPGFGDQCSAN